MNKQSQDPKPEVNLNADKQVVPASKKCTRILEIGITAPLVEEKEKKQPLNLSVVIDRSGSMSGEKLHFAKQAAAHLIDLLDEKDRAGVVMYDSEIDVVSPALEMNAANKTFAKTAIQRITSRGSTNLFGGWLKGCELVAENDAQQSLNRTFLLSDGLANQGITDLDEIASHTRQLFQRGVSTSCFGIGLHYNEHLMEAMANAGGGNFHFLEALSAIPITFEREFEELINVSIRNLTIDLQLPAGAICKISGGWSYTQNGNIYTITAGSLFSGQEQKLYIQLHLPALLENETLEIPVKIKALAADDAVIEIAQTLTFQIVDAEQEARIESDPELMQRFALVDMADQATEALKQARAGNRDDASQILYQSMSRHGHSISRETRSKYTHISNEINNGMDEMAFKRHHQEEYFNKRARMDIRDYPLRTINGHLFTTIQRQHILIDTGIPVSIGAQPEWYFMQSVHKLSQGYLGVTLDEISNFVNAPIEIVMGSDILKSYCVVFELNRRMVNFSSRPFLQGQYEFPMSLLMGVPGMKIDILGSPCDAFLDTGAKLSYVTGDIASNLQSIGVEKDFYPGLGEFETQVYDVDFSLGDQTFNLRCGVLPSLLETTLQVAGKKAIIGVEFLRHFTVQMDYTGKRITLRA